MKRPKWNFTPEMDAIIAAVYRTETGRGQVNLLAFKWNIPRWKISRHALYLGVVEPRQKEPVWSDAEIRILEHWAHLTPERIALKLKAKGYHRSYTAIVLKRKRLRLLSNLKGMSAITLSIAFGVDAKVITRWIERGYLKATKRGTNRTELQGGDAWYIKEKDIRDFIIENIHIIDIRKIDKYWMVDILINGGKDE